MKKQTALSLFTILVLILAMAGFSSVFAGPDTQISQFTSEDGTTVEYRTETYSNGDRYSGQFVNGKFNGEGTYYWANGDFYEGEFMDGKIDGAGRLTFSSWRYWEGLFVNGKITNGSGAFYYGSNGDMFEGPWTNGQPDGPGILLHLNGTSEYVTIKNGVMSYGNSSSDIIIHNEGNYAGSTPSYNPFSNLQVGGTVTFGSYEQDNNSYDGKEPIVWKVLAVYNGQALLLSQNLLEAMPYHYAQVSVTWEGSTLRSWLNSTFYNDAFSEDEKFYIQQTWINNPNNPVYGTYGGNSTFDNVFLLSMDELTYYFPSEYSRKSSPTMVARAHGAYGTADVNCAWWWLRTPGQNNYFGSSVNSIGVLLNNVPVVNDSTGGIRPAIWVNMG